MFHIGQKVARVERPNMRFMLERPALGEPLTITHISHGQLSTYDWSYNSEGLLFAECPPPPGPPECDAHYDGRFFEPIVERKTDISMFTKILRGRELEEV